jgi:hypothetical protein
MVTLPLPRFFMKSVLAALLALTAALVPAQAFERSPWHAPEVAERDGTVSIRVGSTPSGLFFRRQLDAAQRYELTVEGSGGPMTMRVVRDGNPPDYLAAPRGQVSITVVGTTSIELLFYADAPATYDLARLSITPCTACRTGDDVRRRIEADIPDLAGKSGLDKAIALLRWSANVTDYSPDSTLTPPDFEAWPVEKALYEFFDADIGAVSCGGMSVFTRNVLRLFGFDAFTINYGVPDTLVTHVSTVVRIDGRFFLLDPTFGAYYVADAAPVDLIAALQMLKQGDATRLEMRELDLSGRDFIRPGPIEHRVCIRRSVTGAGETLCRMAGTSYAEVFRDHGAERWREIGIPFNQHSLVALILRGVFSVGDGTRPGTRTAFLEALREMGIRMH